MAKVDLTRLARRIDTLGAKRVETEDVDLSNLATTIERPPDRQETPIVAPPAPAERAPREEIPISAPPAPTERVSKEVQVVDPVAPQVNRITTKPWQKIITFEKSSLNSALDSADIAEHELRTASHILLDNGVAEKGAGQTQLGSQLESGTNILGLHRSHNKAGDKKLLVACNASGNATSKVKRWDGAAYQDVQTGLTPSINYDFLNYKDKTLIANGSDEVLEFDPADNSINSIRKYGLEPARWFKKVNYFESDETVVEVSTTGHDGNPVSGTAAANTQFFRNDERSGNTKTSLKLSATAGNRAQGYVAFGSAQDFSAFANTKSFGSNDYVVIWIFHTTRTYASSITIDFYTSSGNYARGTVNTADLDSKYLRDNQWTCIKLKKSQFISTGSPNWASIARVYYSLTAVTGTATVYIDNVYLTNSPIEAFSYRKVISTMDEATADWTVTAGAIADDTTYKKEGRKSIKTTGSTTFNKAVTLDLTQYVNGVTSQTSDEIVLWAYVNGTTNLTSVTLTFTDSSARTWTKEYLAAVFNAPSGWTELRTAKSAFTDSGSADWATIVNIKIATVQSGATPLIIYFDAWRLEEASLQRSLSTMEQGEADAWTFPVAADSGEGEFNNNPKFIAAGDYSIKLTVKPKQSYYSTRVLTAAINLTTYAGSETSGTDDIISFWMHWQNFKYIRSVELDIDCNTGDFATDYFKYEVTPAEIQATLNASGQKATNLNNKSAIFEIKKSDFTRIGATGAKGWDTVKGYKFIVNSVTTGRAIKNTLYFDQLLMNRRKGLTGIYQWCCVFKASDGTRSAPSEWSELTTITGTKALLTNLPTSPDSTRVSEKEIYRKGGDLGSEARLAFTLYDNTITTWLDDTTDAQTTLLFSDESIPTGTIRLPIIGKWGPIFRGRLIGYRDATNYRRLYWSNIGYGYAWSELNAWDFDTDILDVFMKDDILFVNCTSGINKIPVDLGEMTADDIQGMGFVKHSISTRGSTEMETLYAIVSYDGVYTFDGYKTQRISEENGNVKNYFDSTYYDLDNAIAFYRKKHLYISVLSIATDSTGDTDGSTAVVTGLTDTSDFLVGDYVTCSAGFPSAITPYKIISKTSTTLTLDTNSNSAQSNITIAGTRKLLDCYIPKLQWTTKEYVVNAFCIWEGQGDNEEIYVGDLAGNVYQLDTGYATTSVLEPKDFAENPFEEVVVRKVELIGRSASSSPGYLNMKFRVDQTQNDSIILTFPEFRTVTFTGSGLNDMTCSAAQAAAYTGTSPLRIRVQITATGTPDRFKYSTDGGKTWSGEADVAATTAIASGVIVAWAATTGHTLGNYWEFVVSHLASTYKLYESPVTGIENYVKGSMIGIRLYPGVDSKHFAVRAIKLIGEVSPITKSMEE